MGIKDLIGGLIARAHQAAGGDEGLKAMAAMAAIQWGSATVQQIAENVTARAAEAGQQLIDLNQALAAGHAEINTMILRGDFDDAVLTRADLIDASHATGGGGSADLVDDATDTWKSEYRMTDAALADAELAEAKKRTAANGAPDGKPDVPPRMAGGYLAGLADIIPTTGGHGEVDEYGQLVGPEHPFNTVETVPVSDGDDRS